MSRVQRGPGRARAADRRLPAPLRNVAIMTVEGLFDANPGASPREIALQHMDDPGGLRCWLVAPEGRWHPPSGTQGGELRDACGTGAAPAIVARELNAVLAGQRVYAEYHGAMVGWLRRLFVAAGEQPSFRVQDIGRLRETLVKRGGDRARARERLQQLQFPEHRASWEVVAHAAYLLGLAEVGTGGCDDEVYEVDFIVPAVPPPSSSTPSCAQG